jgi:hypothetical protein
MNDKWSHPSFSGFLSLGWILKVIVVTGECRGNGFDLFSVYDRESNRRLRSIGVASFCQSQMPAGLFILGVLLSDYAPGWA